MSREGKVFALLGAALVVTYAPSLFGPFVLFGGDDTLKHLPIKQFSFAAIRDGDLPFWLPYVYGGYPIYASAEGGLFYPPNALFHLADPIGALEWSRVLHIWLGAWHFFRFALRGGATLTRLTLSVVWAASLARLPEITMLHVVTWLPLLFHAWTVQLRRRALYPPAPLVSGLMFLAGHGQLAALSHLFLCCFLLVALRVGEVSVPNWKTPLAGLAISAVIAGLQTFPNIELIRRSERAGGVDLASALRGGIPLPLSLVLAATGILLYVLPPAKTRRRRLPLAVAALFALTAGLPFPTPLYGLLRIAVPFYGAFRQPDKWLIFCMFALLLLLHTVIVARRARPRPLPSLAAFLLVLALAAGGRPPVDRAASLYELLEHQRRGYAEGKDFRVFAPRSSLRSSSRVIKRLSRDARHARWTSDDWEVNPLAPNFNVLDRVPLLEGNLALVPKYFRELTYGPMLDESPDRALGPLPRGVADAFGVRFLVTSKPRRLRGVKERHGAGHLWIYENPHARPPVYWASRVERVRSESEAIAALRRHKSPDGAAALVVGEAFVQPDPSGGPIRIVSARPGYKRLSVSAKGEAFLVIVERHYPGWRARVNGEPTPIRTTNVFVQGLQLPPGKHDIVLFFIPRFFFLYYGSAVGGLLLLLITRFRSKKTTA